MCGFVFIRSKKELEKKKIDFLVTREKKRGPDAEGYSVFKSTDNYNNYFIHFLLDISGKKIVQPIEDNKNILLFNGEIYNYPKNEYSTDTEYLFYNSEKIKGNNNFNLDGEYAYLKFDKIKNECFVGLDAFMTKPLFYGYSDDKEIFGISSYASALKKLDLNVKDFKANSFFKFSFNRNSFEKKIFTNTSKKFDLKQHDDTYQKWENSFLDAVKKRATHGENLPFVSLSSGYDSGAICCALNILNLKYQTYSILKNENLEILNKRLKLNEELGTCVKKNLIDSISFFEKKNIEKDVKLNLDNFTYYHLDRGKKLKLAEDGGTLGSMKIAKIAKLNGFKVHISSCGADEIISDYGFNGKKIFSHSEFGGFFPENLENIFPWKKFYNDSQRSYLFKEEYVFGRYGLESRYPFLDTQVVQNFLNLKKELKNSEYKSPIAFFLRKHDYPFDEGIKLGFNPRNYSLLERILNKFKFLR